MFFPRVEMLINFFYLQNKLELSSVESKICGLVLFVNITLLEKAGLGPTILFFFRCLIDGEKRPIASATAGELQKYNCCKSNLF
jgi:hypothetical protein